MHLGKRVRDSYSEDTSMDTDTRIGFASKWTDDIVNLFRIQCINKEFVDMSERNTTKSILTMPEWKDETWLDMVDISKLNISGKIKTLIAKIKYVHCKQFIIKEVYTDGFMDSLLHLVGFDDYPCLLYPQYECAARVLGKIKPLIAKCDFGIVANDNILLVVENKTMDSVSYSNNWKESQVMGELFIAAHSLIGNTPVNGTIKYPIEIFAVRVIGVMFTFYKAVASKEYTLESARKYPQNTSFTVYRHPNIDEDSAILNAYDIRVLDYRKMILRYLYFIRDTISRCD
jgi:hypothetical protein